MLNLHKENEDETRLPRRTLLKSVGAAGIALGGVGGMSTVALTQPVSAASGSVIDHFDDGDMNEYSVYREGPAEITSTTTYSGPGALKIDGTSTDCISMSGLDSYPSAGDTFSTQVRWTSNANAAIFAYGVQSYTEYSNGEYYYVRIDPQNDDIVLRKADLNGYYTLEKNYSVGLTANTWHELQIEWNSDGTHTITLFDDAGAQITQLSATDSTWTDGGVGFFGRELNSGATVYFDEAVVGDPGPGGSSSSQQSGAVIDSFSDGNLSEYNFIEGASGASVVSSPSTSGSSSLKIDNDDVKMYSMGGLSNYPYAGTTFRASFRAENGADDLDMAYGVNGPEDKYVVRLDYVESRIKLFRRYPGGTEFYSQAYTSTTLAEDEWYDVEIQWDRDGTHTATVYDSTQAELAQISATDSTWTSGGFGFESYLSSGGEGYFDSVLITGRDDTGIGQVVENFEDDLNDYTFVTGQSNADIVYQPAFDGQGALSIAGGSSKLFAKNDLPVEPGSGDSINYHVQSKTGTEEIELWYGTQDKDNSYVAKIDFDLDTISLYRLDSSNYVELDSASLDKPLHEGIWYRVEVYWLENGKHKVDIMSHGGSVSKIDNTWDSGGIGFLANCSSSEGVFIDYVTKNQHIRNTAGKVVDDFEDGTLDEYTYNTQQGTASINTSNSYFGANSLELSDGDVSMESTTGLENYPEAGKHLELRFKSVDYVDSIQFAYAVQSSGDKYVVGIEPNSSTLRIGKKSGGNISWNDSSSNFVFGTNEWYKLVIHWDSDGSQIASLISPSEDRIEQVGQSDQAWTSGGVGYAVTQSSSQCVLIDSIFSDQFEQVIKSESEQHGEVVDFTSYVDSSGNDVVVHHFDDGSSFECVAELQSDSIARYEDQDGYKYFHNKSKKCVSLDQMTMNRTRRRNLNGN